MNMQHLAGKFCICSAMLAGMFLSIFFSVVSGNPCMGQFPECFCDKNNKSMSCKNQNFTMVDMDNRKWFHEIPHYVERLTFTGNYLPSLGPNKFGKKNLIYLNLSSNAIKSIHVDAFKFLINLTELILDNNQWDLLVLDLPKGLFNNVPSLKHLSLKSAFNKNLHTWSWPTDNIRNLSYIFNESLHQLETLNLESNEFVLILNKTMFCHMIQLKTLKLSYNFLQDLNFNISCTGILYLEVANNSLRYLTPRVMKIFSKHSMLKRLDLGGNPFECDCHILPFRHWLNTTNITIPNSRNFECQENSLQGTHHYGIFQINEDDFKCRRTKKEYLTDHMKSVLIVIGIVIAMMCLMIGVVMYLIVRKRKPCHKLFSTVDYTEFGQHDSKHEC